MWSREIVRTITSDPRRTRVSAWRRRTRETCCLCSACFTSGRSFAFARERRSRRFLNFVDSNCRRRTSMSGMTWCLIRFQKSCLSYAWSAILRQFNFKVNFCTHYILSTDCATLASKSFVLTCPFLRSGQLLDPLRRTTAPRMFCPYFSIKSQYWSNLGKSRVSCSARHYCIVSFFVFAQNVVIPISRSGWRSERNVAPFTRIMEKQYS